MAYQKYLSGMGESNIGRMATQTVAKQTIFIGLVLLMVLALSHSTAIGGVDGDGNLDAVFAKPNLTLQVCRGNGLGGFSCTDMSGNVQDHNLDVALGDVNGDGNLDTVFAGVSEKICLGDGLGGFSCTGISEARSPTSGVALGDMNGDGKLDAVFANPNLNHQVCEGNGSGGFSCHDISGERFGLAVALGDVNDDGKLDAVFANPRQNCIGCGPNRVCLGDGLGSFSSCSDIDSSLNVFDSRDVALADMNEDGKLDAIFANSDADFVPGTLSTGARNRVCWGDGSGAFPSCSDVSSDAFRSFGVALGDMNGDGKLDAVFANALGFPIGNTDAFNRLCLRDGTDNFQCQDVSRDSPFGTEGFNSSGVAIGDVNDDGNLDAVFANFLPGRDRVCIGNGQGGFTCSDVAMDVSSSFAVALTPVRYRFVVMADSRSPEEPPVGSPPAEAHNGVVLNTLLTDVKSVDPDFILFGGDLVWGYRSAAEVKAQINGTGNHTGSNAGWKDTVNTTMMDTNYATRKLYPTFGGHEHNTDGTVVWSAFSDVDVFDPIMTGTVHRAGGYFDPTDILECPSGANYGHTVYYFDYRNARYFVLNNDHDPHNPAGGVVGHEIGICQRKWVENTLNTNSKPLNFFIHHEPAYPVQRIVEDHGDAKVASRNAYVKLLGDNNATMIFSGHEHQYTRRTINQNLTPGLTFEGEFPELKTGLAGANPKLWGDPPSYTPRDNIQLEVGQINIDHYAVVDVEDTLTSVVVFAIHRDTGKKTCIDFLPEGGPFPGFPDNSGNGIPDVCDTLNAGFLAGIGADPADIDGDGTPNAQDQDTAAVSVATNGEQLTIDLPETLVLANVNTLLDTSSTLDQENKPDQEFPFGVLTFDVQRINPVPEVTVTLTFSVPVPEESAYFVFDADRRWYTIPIGSNDGDHQITLTLRDGGDGDIDGKVNQTIKHVGAIGTPGPDVLNPLVTFTPIRIDGFSHESTGCLVDEEMFNPFVGTFTFVARLKNQSDMSLVNIQAKVKELTNDNRLQNADIEPTGVGATLTISHDPIGPGEFVDVPFVVCLSEKTRFRFFVDVIGFSKTTENQ